MFNFVNYMRSLVNYAIFGELCDRMRFEVDCAKSHHRVISEGLKVGKMFVEARSNLIFLHHCFHVVTFDQFQ